MLFVYEVLLLTGVLGLLAMALAGFAHPGGTHHAGGIHHAGHADGGSHAGLAPHHGPLVHDAHGGHAAGHGAAAQHAGDHHGGTAHGGGEHAGLGQSLLGFLSPMTLFAACLGAGAVGSLLTYWGMPPLVTGLGAAAGAAGVNALVVRPMVRLVMGFVSTPARGLEGTLLQSAEAITAFDANGEGLVRVLVDGQSVDVLARLTEEERQQGTRVRRGQPVLIEEVDGRRNRCIVSRL